MKKQEGAKETLEEREELGGCELRAERASWTEHRGHV